MKKKVITYFDIQFKGSDQVERFATDITIDLNDPQLAGKSLEDEMDEQKEDFIAFVRRVYKEDAPAELRVGDTVIRMSATQAATVGYEIIDA